MRTTLWATAALTTVFLLGVSGAPGPWLVDLGEWVWRSVGPASF